VAPCGQQAEGADRPLTQRPGPRHGTPPVVRPRPRPVAAVPQALLGRTEGPGRPAGAPEVRHPGEGRHVRLRRQRRGAQQRRGLEGVSGAGEEVTGLRVWAFSPLAATAGPSSRGSPHHRTLGLDELGVGVISPPAERPVVKAHVDEYVCLQEWGWPKRGFRPGSSRLDLQRSG
jgi:hypothetical protein